MNRAFLTWFLVLALAPFTARSQPERTAAREAPRQFLFVVEQSSAMKRKETVTLSTVYQLIVTGGYGAMHRGDIYRIWTFDREVRDKAFAPQAWLPEVAEALAATATKFIHEEKHSRTAKLDPAVARFVEVAKSGVPLTVFLITSGNDVLFGTPFDLEVSTILFQHAEKMAKEKRPYVITLVARDGKIGGWAVDAGGGRITVPAFAEPPVAKQLEPEPVSTKPVVKFTVEPPPAMTAKPKTPKPPPTPEPAKPVAVEPSKASVSPPTVQTPAPPAHPIVPPPNVPTPAPKVPRVATSPGEMKEGQLPPAKPHVEVSAPVPKPTSQPTALPPEPKPVAKTEPAPVKPPPEISHPVVEKAPLVVEKPQPVVEAPKVADVAPVVKPPASAVESAAPTTPESLAPPSKPSPAPPPAQTAVVVPADSGGGGWRFLLLGGALLLVAAIMVAVLVRRGRPVPQASLISQSLDRERKS